MAALKSARSVVTDPEATETRGCLLHNFPRYQNACFSTILRTSCVGDIFACCCRLCRSVEEAKLIEAALMATTEDQPTREVKLKAIEMAIAPEPQLDPACTSGFDCAISVLSISAERAVNGENVDEGSVAGKQLNRPPTGKSRPSAAGLQDTSDPVALQLANQRAVVRQYWERTTHLLKVRFHARNALRNGRRCSKPRSLGCCFRNCQVDPVQIHQDVLLESVHLSIDTLTRPEGRDSRCVWEVSANDCPKQLVEARSARQATMALAERFKWAQASNETTITCTDLATVSQKLNEVSMWLS